MDKELNDILNIVKDKSFHKELDNILLQPYNYIQQTAGKTFRSQLSTALNHWLKVPEEKFNKIEELLNMVHLSGLLIDDIEDNSIIRQGRPVAHRIYGVPSTINSGNYAYFLALQKAYELGHPDAAKIYLEESITMHRGQGMDIYWRDNFVCPSEMDYKLMCIQKLGGIIMYAIRTMQLFSEDKRDYSKLSAIICLYYQITDDYCNSSLKGLQNDKSFAEDITEGKFSFPIRHATQQQKCDLQIMHILRQRTQDVVMKNYCIDQLEKMGSLEYTRGVLETLDKDARAEVKRLGGNPLLEQILNKLHTNWKRSNEAATPFS